MADRCCCPSVQFAPAGNAAVNLQFRLYRGGSGKPLERVALSAQALDKVCTRAPTEAYSLSVSLSVLRACVHADTGRRG